MKSSLAVPLISIMLLLFSFLKAQVEIEFNSAPGKPHLILKEIGDADDFARLYFQNAESDSLMLKHWTIAGKAGVSDFDSRLYFYYNGNDLSDYLLSMTSDRKVGIGTFNPSTALTIQQTSTSKGISLIDYSLMHRGNLWMDGNNLKIQNGDTDLNGFAIQPNRRIGVFTDEPYAMVDIYDSASTFNDHLFTVRKSFGGIIDFTIFEVQNDYEVYARQLGINVEDPSDLLHINSSGSINPLRVQVGESTKLRVLTNGGTSIGGNNEDPPVNGLYVNGQMHVGTDSGTDRLSVKADAGENALRVAVGNATKLRVLSNGGTSIGSNNLNPPADGLFVNGNLHVGTTSGVSDYKVAVDGKIICEELRVQLSSEWPDFVFSDQYDLTSLYELNMFISKHQHLPGIPTADEMHEQGIAVSEMMTTLVQKIEELTLYILDQDTRIKALEHKLIESQK